MSRNHCAQTQYLRSIRKALPHTGKTKRYILAQINESILDYLIKNPDADMESLCTHFGTPEWVGGNCTDFQDTYVLLEKGNTKRKYLSIIAGTMALIVSMGAGFMFWNNYISKTDDGIYCIEEIEHP